MRKLPNSTRDYLKTLRGNRLEVAQNGIGYNLDQLDPESQLGSFDSFLDIGKSAGAGYLGSKTFHDSYYASKFPNDPKEAKRRSDKAALTSGIYGGIRSVFSQIKENRDYQADLDRIKKIQAQNYYRVPVDNYAYNENLSNPFGNTAYKNGGAVRKYQVGGLLPSGQDTFNQYGQPVVMPVTQPDAYTSVFKNTLPDVDKAVPALREEYNILHASDRLNRGLLEQTNSKTKSKVERFVERKSGGVANQKAGGACKSIRPKRYQDGGEVESNYYTEPSTEVFDSTGGYDSGQGNYEPNNEYYQASSYDEIPTTEDGQGYDLSRLTPTLGGVSISNTVTGGSIQGVIDQIATKESGGRYDVVNKSGGKDAIFATGKYQFVPKYWHKQIADFQGTPGKSMQETMELFRQSPKTQDAFMQHVVNDVYMPAVQRMLPLARIYGLGQNELIKMIHYRGISDTQKRLEKGDFQVSASERQKYKNPSIMEYIKG